MSGTRNQESSYRQQRKGLKKCRDATRMANATVSIDCGTRVGSTGIRGFGMCPVLLEVVAQMLGTHTYFMLTIACHCSPSELHRQKSYEKDEEPAAHCVMSLADATCRIQGHARA